METSNGFARIIAFHYGNFDNHYGDGTIANATKNGRIYADSSAADLPADFGTLTVSGTSGGQTTYSWTPVASGRADLFIVAGGGGGGSYSEFSPSGGGGGGEVVLLMNQFIPGTQRNISVGRGGFHSENGQDSLFVSLNAIGGGSGRATGGVDGGSGGGGGRALIGGNSIAVLGLGSNGGSSVGASGGSGGGGATEPGQPGLGTGGSTGGGGNGGQGYALIGFSGFTDVYGSGGGGGARSSPEGIGGTNAGSGGYSDAMSHKGGGGGGRRGTTINRAGYGGSGIVLIRFMYDARPPPTIPNLAAWYTASSAEVQNGSVNFWRDLSGRGNHVEAAAITGSVKRADPNDSSAVVQAGVTNLSSGAKIIAFHYGNFNNEYGHGAVSNATYNGRIFANSSALNLPSDFGSIIVSGTSGGQTTYSWTPPAGAEEANLLIVAGGGGGGNNGEGNPNRGGGGGGGGEVVYLENFLNFLTTSTSTIYPIVIGAGGSSRASGKDSRFGDIYVAGGGYGESAGSGLGNNIGSSSGGSGGGALGGSTNNGSSVKYNTFGKGFAGRDGTGDANGSGGGGGGATGGTGTGRSGGAGFSTTIFDNLNDVYGSGGGGGDKGADDTLVGTGGTNAGNGGLRRTAGGAAVANKGGGGGGAGAAGSTASTLGQTLNVGGTGGSGIVIISFRTTTGRGSTAFPFLYGSPTDGLRFPTSAMDTTSNYTLFHVARYYKPTGTPTRLRIFDGVTSNWLSGFVSGRAGGAYHGKWLTAQTDLHGNEWVLSTDQNNMYRSNGTDRTLTGITGGISRQLSINYGNYTSERSDWAVAEVLIYDRQLTLNEYLTIESYLVAKYFGFATIPESGLISGSLINAMFYTGAQGGSSGNAGARGYPLSIARLGTRIGKTLGSVLRAVDYRGKGAGALDSIGLPRLPVAAYSLRRLFKDYEGPQVRVRRSTDNVEANIYMDSVGAIVSISGSVLKDLSAWLGGATAFVAIWYDQSGSGKSITQNSTSLQPTLIVTNNDRSHVRFQSKIMQGPKLFNTDVVTNMHLLFISRENIGSNNFFINLNGTNTGTPGRFSAHAPYGNRIWYWDAGDTSGVRALSPASITSIGAKTLFSGYKSTTENKNGFRLNQGPRYLSSTLGVASVVGGLYIGNGTTDHSLYELIVFSTQLQSLHESEIELNMQNFSNNM